MRPIPVIGIIFLIYWIWNLLRREYVGAAPSVDQLVTNEDRPARRYHKAHLCMPIQSFWGVRPSVSHTGVFSSM